jgi:hypothetical protein
LQYCLLFLLFIFVQPSNQHEVLNETRRINKSYLKNLKFERKPIAEFSINEILSTLILCYMTHKILCRPLLSTDKISQLKPTHCTTNNYNISLSIKFASTLIILKFILLQTYKHALHFIYKTRLQCIYFLPYQKYIIH